MQHLLTFHESWDTILITQHENHQTTTWYLIVFLSSEFWRYCPHKVCDYCRWVNLYFLIILTFRHKFYGCTSPLLHLQMSRTMEHSGLMTFTAAIRWILLEWMIGSTSAALGHTFSIWRCVAQACPSVRQEAIYSCKWLGRKFQPAPLRSLLQNMFVGGCTIQSSSGHMSRSACICTSLTVSRWRSWMWD